MEKTGVPEPTRLGEIMHNMSFIFRSWKSQSQLQDDVDTDDSEHDTNDPFFYEMAIDSSARVDTSFSKKL